MYEFDLFLTKGVIMDRVLGKTFTLLTAMLMCILMTASSFAASTDLTGSSWTGTLHKNHKVFNAYASYEWQPDYNDTQARLHITAYGIQCQSKISSLYFPAKAEKSASVSVNLEPVKGGYTSKTHSTNKKSAKMTFPGNRTGSKLNFLSKDFYWYFNKTDKPQTLTLSVSASKGKQSGSTPKAWMGSSSGSVALTVPAKSVAAPQVNQTANAVVDFPASSRGKTAEATVTNNNGKTYNYKIYNQTSGYPSYSKYIDKHGCSTCALTTILRATKGEFSDLTPNETITQVIKETVSAGEFNNNFKKRNRPVTLWGMMKIFDKYGVSYQLPTTNAADRNAEITA